ncbi:hypothetical protein, partial [Salmonella sp. S146_54837]|uniref:hypothetical protein n=1 Tax=Salmonella sp. S146_54837 TaxID=2665635 RepID=UPI0034D511C7
MNNVGGTISITGVSLTVPADALTHPRVISVTVMYEPDVHLPGSDHIRRMTPLIKLDPLGLKFDKPVYLTIPHSAVIPDPDRHRVCIYTGQTDGNNGGEITWMEETSLKWGLDQEKISLYINRLSYLFVKLVS